MNSTTRAFSSVATASSKGTFMDCSSWSLPTGISRSVRRGNHGTHPYARYELTACWHPPKVVIETQGFILCLDTFCASTLGDCCCDWPAGRPGVARCPEHPGERRA